MEALSIWIQPAVLMAAFIFFWREARGGRQETRADMLQIESRIIERINIVDKKIDRLEGRMNGVERQLERLDERMNSFEGQLVKLDERLNAVEGQLNGLGERMVVVEGLLVGLDNKTIEISNDIREIKQSSKTSRTGSTPLT